MDAWEGKIDALGKSLRLQLVEEVKGLREKAVDSLSEESTDAESLGALVKAFKRDGEKALKGTQAYAAKLLSGHYHGAEKIALFDSVITKVDARYTSSAAALSGKISAWWGGVREEVQGRGRKRAGEVLAEGQRAQGDLGMDLSYLDDVTTRDWGRYHSLLEREFILPPSLVSYLLHLCY